MKFIRLSTTSKLYLLTLLTIFAVIFINQSVFAQAEKPASTTTQKRLATMELYLSWINTNQYGEFQDPLGNKALADFNSFLSKAVSDDKDCLTPKNSPEPGFVGNIQTFFLGITSQNPQPQAPSSEVSSCKGKIKEDYKLAKKYNRLLKYLQIEEGDPNVCIRADLGVGTALLAHGFNPTKVNSDNPKETGNSGNLPLYLCTGNDGKKKVRVVDDSGTRLRLSTEDAAKAEFKVENLPPQGSLDILLGKLNLK
jgi:hypothetical protein